MDRTQLLIALIGSAAVGALVSSLITELGGWRERKSRREELVLAKAADLVQFQVQTMTQVFKDTATSGKIAPPALVLEDYYVSLKHLLEKGELDSRMKSRVSAEMQKHGA